MAHSHNTTEFLEDKKKINTPDLRHTLNVYNPTHRGAVNLNCTSS